MKITWVVIWIALGLMVLLRHGSPEAVGDALFIAGGIWVAWKVIDAWTQPKRRS